MPNLNQYNEIVYRELPLLLDRFTSIGPEFYNVLSHQCFQLFCQGVYAGLHGIDKQPIGINLISSSKRTPVYMLGDFAHFGYTLGKKARDSEGQQYAGMPDLMSAVEYVSERLGCSQYCSKAIDNLMQPLQTEDA